MSRAETRLDSLKVPYMIVPSGVRVPPPRPEMPMRSFVMPSSCSRSAIAAVAAVGFAQIGHPVWMCGPQRSAADVATTVTAPSSGNTTPIEASAPPPQWER